MNKTFLREWREGRGPNERSEATSHEPLVCHTATKEKAKENKKKGRGNTKGRSRRLKLRIDGTAPRYNKRILRG